MDSLFGLLLLLAMLALNVGIATWNAYMAGRMWKFAEGFGPTVLLLGALTQSVVGYSSALIVVGVLGGYGAGWLDEEYLTYTMHLWYLAVIFPAVGTGLVIWLHIIMHAIRNPSLRIIGVAGWNTFAQLHNIYGMMEHVPKAASGVGELFKGLGKSKLDGRAVVAIVIVLLALSLAILITAVVFALGRQATLAEIGDMQEHTMTKQRQRV